MTIGGQVSLRGPHANLKAILSIYSRLVQEVSRPIFYTQRLGRYSARLSWTPQLVHCEYEGKLSLKVSAEDVLSSKSSPSPSTYDEPGKPFDALLSATGCTADSTALACLTDFPFEVHYLLFNST